MKKTSIVVILVLVVLCVLLPWVLLRGDGAKVGENPLFPWVVAFLCLLPIYPLYTFAKQWPPLRAGITVIGVNLVLTLILALLHYALHLDNVWIDRMFDVSNVLFFCGCLLLVWRGLRLRRQ